MGQQRVTLSVCFICVFQAPFLSLLLVIFLLYLSYSHSAVASCLSFFDITFFQSFSYVLFLSFFFFPFFTFHFIILHVNVIILQLLFGLNVCFSVPQLSNTLSLSLTHTHSPSEDDKEMCPMQCQQGHCCCLSDQCKVILFN